MHVSYLNGRASEECISAHLTRCDTCFIPSLSRRIDIASYSRKIAEQAENFEAWSNGELVGLIAVYCNCPHRLTAFITNVSVDPSWQGKGVATKLLEHCIYSVRKLGFKRIELEVDSENKAAITLYTKYGFIVKQFTNSVQKMAVGLERDFE